MRSLALALLGSILVFSPAGCSAPSPAKPAPLPAVAEVPAAPLPSWIADISPSGEAQGGAQVRVRFKDDLVPVEALESPDRQEALSHFSIEPNLPGRFVFWTPRMVGFEGDVPFPKATRIRVTIGAGLKDLKNHTLAADYAWSFTTEPIALTVPGAKPGETPEPTYESKPVLTVGSNVALDTSSLLEHAHIVDGADSSHTIALDLQPEPSPSPSSAGSAGGPVTGDESASYNLVPKETLELAHHYQVVVDPGVLPAGGNLATDDRQSGRFQTYGAFVLTGVDATGKPVEGGPSRFVGGTPELQFSNGLAASDAPLVSVSPAPASGVPLFRITPGDSTIPLNEWALAPDTHYTITVSGNTKDQYGQTLGQDVGVTFDTGDLTGDVWAPQGLSVFPSGPDLRLNIETTNLPERKYVTSYVPIEPRRLVTFDPAQVDVTTLLPPVARWRAQPAGGPKNETRTTAVPLRAELGAATGMLAYGVNARTYQYRDDNGKLVWQAPTFAGVVQLTNIGLFAQWFPNGGTVRTARLSDGTPLAHVAIDIYESLLDPAQKPHADPDQPPCASGETDAGGVWTLDNAAFTRCASTALNAQAAPELLVVARNGSDWAYTRTYQWNAYGNFWGGWSAGAPNSHGTIVCDRELYQPGETAQFTGIAYFETNGVLARGRSPSYAIAIVDADGKRLSLGRRSLDAFGAFTIPYAVAKSAATGYYTIEADGDGGEILTGQFRIAQFKPPNFKVDLTLGTAIAAMGSSVDASSTSTYLFGAPVAGGSSHVYVTRSQTVFTPKGWDAYTFGRSWWYPDEPPSVSSDVLDKTLTIDAQGKAAVPVPVATDLPYAMAYTVDAETTDASNLSVADTKTFTALPSDALIGLSAGYVALAGKPVALEAIVVDPRGTPLPSRKLHLVLQRRDFTHATQLVEGSQTARDAVRYIDVASADIESQSGPVRVSLTPDKPGSYRVRANFAGATDEVSATDQDLWVTGPGEVDWGALDPNSVTVKLDKATYRPGDTATALIQSPYADAELFFSVVRHGVLYQTRELVHGAAPQVRFTVTPEMLPNAAVEAMLVRRGKPLAAGIPPGLGKLARIGVTPFEVALDGKYVKVALSVAHASVLPAGAQHLTIHLSDRNGKPVAGELTVAVANDAILQLSGYRFPDLVKIVYADQPISTRFADNRADVTLVSQTRTLDKGFGYGGGAMAGPAGTRVRTNFQPLAYWNAKVRTDANGNASLDFNVPDDLTTWRVMALALTADARFGNGEATFVATKPLVTNPILPQFVRPGDRFSAGVAVTDVAKASGTYAIDAQLSGDLAFVDGEQRSMSKTLRSPQDALNQAFRFDVMATGPNGGQARVRTDLGMLSDAFAVPVTVGIDGFLESAVQTGTTQTGANVPLNVDPALPAYLGGLDLTLASTLLANAAEPERLLSEERPPFATSLASRIGIAADAIVLDRIYGQSAKIAPLQKGLLDDLAALRTLALPDGGFACWPGAKQSDVYSTAFAAKMLVQAKRAGISVDLDLARVIPFLEKRLADPASCNKDDALCLASARLAALSALVELGEQRSDHLAEIDKQRASFDFYEQVTLARLMLRLPDWHAQGLALRDKLMEQVYLTGRRATVNVPGYFGTPVAAQAQVVSMLVESNAPQDDVDRALTGLLGLARNGLWGCLCDNAEAMSALVSYAKAQGAPPDFSASATVGATNFEATFQGYAQTSAAKTIPMAELPRGKSTIALAKSGHGTLHYAVAFRYAVPPASPGIYAGIRIDRFVRPANESDVLLGFGLAAPAQQPSLAAARVYDIEDRITTDHDLTNVIVEDPLPGGLEAVDTTFQTATSYFQPGLSDWSIDYQQIYRDRVLSFAAELPAGVYAVHYLVRSVTPGDFAWPGARVSLQYFPEEFGRTATSRLTITP